MKGPQQWGPFFWNGNGHNRGVNLAPPNSRSQAWSSFWSKGSLHSCIDSFGQDYAGTIGDFWRAIFADVNPGDRVIDLATGNGALPLLLSHEQGKNVWIDGVDLATVAPIWHEVSRYPNICFHSRTAVENLPFSDASFDLVVSQFGLEYAFWPAALLECVRVMRPLATAAFVMHHADSVLVKVGAAEAANQAFLLAPDGLLAAASQVIPWIERARAGELNADEILVARESRAAYNHAMANVGAEIERSPIPDLLLESRQLVHGLLSTALAADADSRLAALAEYRQCLDEASLRTAELIQHALDQQGVDKMFKVLQQALPSHSCSCQVLRQEQGILGWAVLVRPIKAGSSTFDWVGVQV